MFKSESSDAGLAVHVIVRRDSGRRVPNSRSRDTERSLPELSFCFGYNEVGDVGRT